MNDTNLPEKCFRERNVSWTVMLTVVLIFFSIFLTGSYGYTNSENLKRNYGYHKGAIFQISSDAMDKIREHRAVRETGAMDIYGTVLSDEENTAGYLGSVDEGFETMEQIRFLEGRWPQKEGEIAMEYSMLDYLNIPYDIGQEITLTIGVDENKTVTRTFTLVGITDAFADNWKMDGGVLAGAVIYPEENADAIHNLFFTADYRTEEQMQELKALLGKNILTSLVFNDASYPEAMKMSVDALVQKGAVTFAVFCFSIVFCACVMMSSSKKKAHRMRIMLLLGSDRKEMNRLVLRSSLATWGRSALLSLAICGAAGGILTAAKGNGSIIFHLTWRPFLGAGILSFVTVLVGEILMRTIFVKNSILPRGRGLAQTEDAPKMDKKRVPVRDIDSFVRLERRKSRKYLALECILGAISSFVLFFCLYGICKEIRYYTSVQEISGYDYKWDSGFPDEGLGIDDIKKIRTVAGIRDVVYTTQVNQLNEKPIFMTYDQSEKDPYRDALNGVLASYYDIPADAARISLVSLPQDSGMWDYYFPDSVDKEAFLRGDEVVMFLPDLLKTDENYAMTGNVGFNDIKGGEIQSSLAAGDTITISTEYSTATARIGAVLKAFPSAKSGTSAGQTYMDFLLAGTVFVSENLMNKIVKETTGRDARYNYVMAFGNRDLSYEITDKVMSRIAKDQNLFYN